MRNYTLKKLEPFRISENIEETFEKYPFQKEFFESLTQIKKINAETFEYLARRSQ